MLSLYPRRGLAGGLGALMLARMKIELSVVVLSDGAASAPQTLAVDAETPGLDASLDAWGQDHFAPAILAGTDAAAGDSAIADVRFCEGGLLPVGSRFTVNL